MKKIRFPSIVLFIFVISTFLFCDYLDYLFDNDDTPEGVYYFTNYDSTGVRLSTGWLKLKQDSTHLTGEWKFKALSDSNKNHPVVGEGNIKGTVRDTIVTFDLYPGYMDHNVVMTGTFFRHRLEGEWKYYSFIGLTDFGTFKGIK